ncbi:hypothetical protein VNO78_22010 [Psophocarpus tetragonolobus]|uniref:Uncharacterized protein n=1 Tax=Psophocarpus tetragonolobus TaxID=3891 RepID=A0AAN9SC05_PSOTE
MKLRSVQKKQTKTNNKQQTDLLLYLKAGSTSELASFVSQTIFQLEAILVFTRKRLLLHLCSPTLQLLLNIIALSPKVVHFTVNDFTITVQCLTNIFWQWNHILTGGGRGTGILLQVTFTLI